MKIETWRTRVAPMDTGIIKRKKSGAHLKYYSIPVVVLYQHILIFYPREWTLVGWLHSCVLTLWGVLAGTVSQMPGLSEDFASVKTRAGCRQCAMCMLQFTDATRSCLFSVSRPRTLQWPQA